MADETQDRRSILEDAYDTLSATETTVEAAPAVETEVPAPDAAPPPAQSDGRARDEAGRFAKSTEKSTAAPEGAKKAGTDKTVAADPGKAAGTPSPVPAAPPASKFKAPQSWRLPLREKFGALDPEFQEEAVRLDREYQKIQQEAAEVRKRDEVVQRTLAPFEGLARSQGMDAMQYAGTVMQTAAALHMGTPQQKAAIVAQLIGTYGIDVDAVNAVMQGQAPQAAPQQRPVDVRSEIDRYFQERQLHETQSQAQRAIEQAKAECEFWDDVGHSKIVRLAAALVTEDRGLAPEVALKNAYEMLAERHPDVSGTLKQRKAAEAAKAQAASTQAARAAAGSVRSTPAATGTAAKPANRREALEKWEGWNR